MTPFGLPDGPVGALRNVLGRLAAERATPMVSARWLDAHSIFVGHQMAGGWSEHGLQGASAPDWLPEDPEMRWLADRGRGLQVLLGPAEAWLQGGHAPWIGRRADGSWDAPVLGGNSPSFAAPVRAAFAEAARRLAATASGGLHLLFPHPAESAHARADREALLADLSADARAAIGTAQEAMNLHRRIHAAVADGACLLVGLVRPPPGLGVLPLLPCPLHLAIAPRSPR